MDGIVAVAGWQYKYIDFYCYPATMLLYHRHYAIVLPPSHHTTASLPSSHCHPATLLAIVAYPTSPLCHLAGILPHHPASVPSTVWYIRCLLRLLACLKDILHCKPLKGFSTCLKDFAPRFTLLCLILLINSNLNHQICPEGGQTLGS
jgi:hypothetical protein